MYIAEGKYHHLIPSKIELKTEETPNVLKERCLENMQQINRRTPMPKCDFKKVAKQIYWNRASAWVFSCKFAAYLPNNFS